MIKNVLDRIEERLEATGLSAAKASSLAGLSKDAIRNFRRAVEAGKETGASTKTLEKLAPVLKTSVGYLLNGEDVHAQPGSPVRKVTVAAFVQAGAFAETWEWDEADQYSVFVPDDPALRGLRLYAAETRGPSMNRRYPEGTIIVFADVDSSRELPVAGKRYVVERRRPGGEAEHTVKLLHIDEDGKFWLIPESDDPRFQAPISIDDGTSDGDTVAIIGRVCFAVMRE